ncbi:hypothetical protein [Dyadobacter sp. CY356]|uniref:hypothetical protein n=1 Tax=Dyadobacter sp. CY356 TaxID=2906442 RepID=UPI001F3644FB|nr:hypothetical protein [Dyadobacter sp. CY356]MCF0058049.1 hypothetical protein [Dyadobacter sp. CY356]
MLEFEIDKLTNSIESSISGETFETVVLPFDVSKTRFLKKKDWIFNWKEEAENELRSVYKLVTNQNPKIIHGLVSISINQDHVFLHLVESAKFNKGSEKLYLGVAGNLIAFACKIAFENGFNGTVVFDSKTKLITHYQLSIGAKILIGNRMFIDFKEANSLVKHYFK